MIQGFITPQNEIIKLSHDQLLSYCIKIVNTRISKEDLLQQSHSYQEKNPWFSQNFYYEWLLKNGYKNLNPLEQKGITQIKKEHIFIVPSELEIPSHLFPSFIYLENEALSYYNPPITSFQNTGLITPTGGIICWDYHQIPLHDMVAFAILNAYFLEHETAYHSFLETSERPETYLYCYYHYIRYCQLEDHLVTIDSVQNENQERTILQMNKILKQTTYKS